VSSEKTFAWLAGLYLGYEFLRHQTGPCGGYDAQGQPVNCTRVKQPAFNANAMLGDLLRIKDYEAHKGDYPNYSGYLTTSGLSDAQHADWWAKVYPLRAQTDAALRAASGSPALLMRASPSYAYERFLWRRAGAKDPGPTGWLVMDGVVRYRWDTHTSDGNLGWLGDIGTEIDRYADKLWGKFGEIAERIGSWAGHTLTRVEGKIEDELGRQWKTAGDFLEKCTSDGEEAKKCADLAAKAFGG